MKKLLLKLIGIEGPFNGWKTIAGMLLYFLPVLFPKAAPAEIEALVQGLGGLLAALGVLHKAWKNFDRDGANVAIALLLMALPMQAQAQAGIYTDIWQVVPVLQFAGAYTAGDILGGELTVQDADAQKTVSGIITAVQLIDADNEGDDYKIYIYKSNPAGTYTDDAAFAFVEADATKLICIVTLTMAADIMANGSDHDVLFEKGVDCPFRISSGSALYAVLVNDTGSTYTAATDVTLNFFILEDKKN